MSYWDNIPFDILTTLLPYLSYDNPFYAKLSGITKLCLDSSVNRRLNLDDPNGHIWKFLFTRYLSQSFPVNSTRSLKEVYLDYLSKFGDIDDLTDRSDAVEWAAKMNCEIAIQHIKEKYELNCNMIWRILTIAAKHGNLNIVKFMIDNYRINRSDFRTVLSFASEYDQLEILKYLDSNFVISSQEFCKAIRSSARNGYLETTKYLVSMLAKSDENIKIDICDRILKVAANNGHLEVVKFLVEQGENNASAKARAIKSAIQRGHLDIVKFLME